MNTSMPQNDAEAGYIAFAMVDELITLLIRADRISRADVDLMFEAIFMRLSQENNSTAKRAAKFITNRAME
jgi:hypothetical protein